MAQRKKKKGLKRRRGAASQALSSDSEDGEFEIQAEDDTRAQKVGAWRSHTLWRLSPCSVRPPAASVSSAGEWALPKVGRGQLAGVGDTIAGLGTSLGAYLAQGLDGPSQ